MAENDTADKLGQTLNIGIRRALNNAYAFVKGRESVQSFSAFTFEDAVDQQIERIQGAGTSYKLNDIDRVTKVENDITQAVANIKKLPPENVIPPNADTDVNTPVEDE